MLLSAVPVLVVAQSSSEIPEGLMNNPVLCYNPFRYQSVATRLQGIGMGDRHMLLCHYSTFLYISYLWTSVEVAGYCMLRKFVFCIVSSKGYYNYQTRRGRWTGHVASMKHRRSLYVILVENTDVKNTWKSGSLQNRMGGCGINPPGSGQNKLCALVNTSWTQYTQLLNWLSNC